MTGKGDEKNSPSDSPPSQKAMDGPKITKTVNLDVVELLKQVLQWTPLYKPGLNKALLQAAKVGSAGCVRVLLSAGADVDTEDENGDTPFVLAFRGHYLEVMELLRDAGCTTEIAKMSLALATKDVEFVKSCYRLDIPVENEDWNTADEHEVTLLLEELQIDPFLGQYGSHGYEDSPFMYLAQEGKPEILQLLVAKHPCFNKYEESDRQDKMNEALHKAIKHRRWDNSEVLLDHLGAELEATDCRDRTAFMAACESDERIALELLKRGASIEQLDSEGLSPLHWAACVGYFELAKILIEKGASVNAKAKLGATPLMVACSGGHLGIAQHLIQNQCDVNSSTPEGWTALHVAVWASAPAVVHLLLSSKALPDSQSQQLSHNSDVVPASTPLLIAICLDSVKIFRHLLEANCDINLSGMVCRKNSDDGVHTEIQTPIEYSIHSRSWDIASLLIRAGCKVDSMVHWLEEGKSPVPIPEDKRKHLRKMVRVFLESPRALRDLSRQEVRMRLGYNLVDKVETLELPLATKNQILLHDLFSPPEGKGSFEV